MLAVNMQEDIFFSSSTSLVALLAFSRPY